VKAYVAGRLGISNAILTDLSGSISNVITNDSDVFASFHVVPIRRQLRWRDVVLPIVVEVSHHSPYVPTSSTI
jgi:hypothetical protein